MLKKVRQWALLFMIGGSVNGITLEAALQIYKGCMHIFVSFDLANSTSKN